MSRVRLLRKRLRVKTSVTLVCPLRRRGKLSLGFTGIMGEATLLSLPRKIPCVCDANSARGALWRKRKNVFFLQCVPAGSGRSATSPLSVLRTQAPKICVIRGFFLRFLRKQNVPVTFAAGTFFVSDLKIRIRTTLCRGGRRESRSLCRRTPSWSFAERCCVRRSCRGYGRTRGFPPGAARSHSLPP